MKFQLLIKNQNLKNEYFSCFQTQMLKYFTNILWNANNFIYFNIYELDKFYAQLS